MKTKVINESGYEEASLGFSLSYNSTIDRAKELFPIYAFKQGGENKFLESIIIWLDVTAPRFWWQEADTYRLSTKQSESTMHTLCKHWIGNECFEYPLNNDILDVLNKKVDYYTQVDKSNAILADIKATLPEGFLQRRIWCMSYKTLQNIYNQRKNHKLPQWKFFLDIVLSEIDHPEFIVKEFNNKKVDDDGLVKEKKILKPILWAVEKWD